MRNYTNSLDNAKFFIEFYEIKNDKIIMYMADGKVLSTDLNEQNELKIINLMEQQVDNAYDEDFLRSIKSKKKNIGFNALTGIVFLGISTAIICLASKPILLFTMICLGWGGIKTFRYVYNYISSRNVLNDFRKSLYYMDNKEEFKQENLKKEQVLVKLKPLTRGKVVEESKRTLGLTINSLEDYTLEELKQIKEALSNKSIKKTLNRK